MYEEEEEDDDEKKVSCCGTNAGTHRKSCVLLVFISMNVRTCFRTPSKTFMVDFSPSQGEWAVADRSPSPPSSWLCTGVLG